MERVTQWTDFQIIYYKPKNKVETRTTFQPFSTEIYREREREKNIESNCKHLYRLHVADHLLLVAR